MLQKDNLIRIQFCGINFLKLAVRKQLDRELDLKKSDVDIHKCVIECHGGAK